MTLTSRWPAVLQAVMQTSRVRWRTATIRNGIPRR